LVRRRNKDPLYAFVEDSLDAIDRYLVWRDDNPLPGTMDNETRKTVEAVQFAFARAAWSMAELFRVYTDVIGCLKMARKYPWDPKYIRRADHFRFISILFLQLVYVFEERMKRSVQWCEIVPKIDPNRVENKKFFRELKKHLGPTIRARGQYVHQGHNPDERIVLFEAIELTKIGIMNVKGVSEREHGLRATKKYLCDRISAELNKMEMVLGPYYQEHVPLLVSRMKKYHEFVQHLIAESAAA
jgi:hypothetical protein